MLSLKSDCGMQITECQNINRSMAAITGETCPNMKHGSASRSVFCTPHFAIRYWRIVFLLLFLANLAGAEGRLWRQALPGYVFQFPRDHGSHPDYKIEWWYYTGSLSTREGARFGYQLTFFRVGIDPQPSNPSRWAVRDLFMTHFAITDVDGRTFQFADRMNRAGIGWAGAKTKDLHVWNQDWEAISDAEGRHRLKAANDAMSLELQLAQGPEPVVHGVGGISQKGNAPGNASHYYSLTRMPTRGELRVSGRRHTVEGFSWMDHEFGTSFLEKEQVGWDWFSLQLDDGSDWMMFQLRRADGTRDRHSSATWIRENGPSHSLRPDQFTLTPGALWISASSGAHYPIAWKVAVPSQGLSLSVRAVVPNQELHTEKSTGVTYWEGAIDVSGTRQGKPIRGHGYLEMTGYAGKPLSEKFK